MEVLADIEKGTNEFASGKDFTLKSSVGFLTRMPTESQLAKKLMLKPKMQARFVNTPAGFWQNFGTLPKGVALQSGGYDTCDWVLVFAKTRKELLNFGPDALLSVKSEGTFWAAYPKKTSGQQTDLTNKEGWQPITEEGYESVSTAAIDEVWTAVRFRKQDDSQ